MNLMMNITIDANDAMTRNGNSIQTTMLNPLNELLKCPSNIKQIIIMKAEIDTEIINLKKNSRRDTLV